MDRVFFEGIRCFAKRQEVPLAPLTVLVGENSSGKSTVLALIRLAWDLAARKPVDFNEEPFLLGAFNQIASFRIQEYKDPSFSLGWAFDEGSITGIFASQGGQPILDAVIKEAPPYRQRLNYNSKTNSLEQEDKSDWVDYEREFALSQLMMDDFGCPRPYAFAPIRMRPRRTYDPIKTSSSPEGEHIPLLLASSSLVKSDGWRLIARALDSFGKHSGLFESVRVRHLGRGESDPFQIQIRIGGERFNLIDVGYGVSQILPIVIDCLRGESQSTYLLQQPEVHLHPRAQAELGSFLAVLAKEQRKHFVIETHSDYLVDRIRMDIRDRKSIKPKDVALLYFERKGGETTIHRLELDDQGNILNAPPGYRSFFLEEERRFLGG